MILKKYQTYLFSEFLKKFVIVSLILCIIIIVNIFEEIRFENIMQNYILLLFYHY